MKNKKAQKGMPISIMIGLIIGVVVMVIVILGFFMGWDYIFGRFGIIPGSDLEVFTQGCVVAAQGNLRTSFCEIKESPIYLPTGQRVYMNCDSIREDIAFQMEVDQRDLPNCRGNEAINFCNEKREFNLRFNSFLINVDGDTRECKPLECDEVGVEEAFWFGGGELSDWMDFEASGAEEITKYVSDRDNPENEDLNCFLFDD